jgi:hypothetical protein
MGQTRRTIVGIPRWRQTPQIRKTHKRAELSYFFPVSSHSSPLIAPTYPVLLALAWLLQHETGKIL